MGIVALRLNTKFISSNQRRAEIEMRPVVPASIRGDSLAIKEWVDSLAILMSPDFKFTNEWGCEICGVFITSTEVRFSSDYVLLDRETGERKQVQRHLLETSCRAHGRVVCT